MKQLDLDFGFDDMDYENQVKQLKEQLIAERDLFVEVMQSPSEISQAELEPIYHPTEHDESDDLEDTKKHSRVQMKDRKNSS